MVKQIKDKAEFDEKIKGSKVVAVDFTATWCGPCKMIGPIFEELSKDYANIDCIKVDVDELDTVAQEAGVSAMPTFFFYKNGKKIDELVGANKDKLKELLEKHNK